MNLDNIIRSACGERPADLYAYIAAGIASDHECMTTQEAKENLKALLPVVNSQTAI